MNVEIGTVTQIFLFWEYLFRNFGILSLQCNSQLTTQRLMKYLMLARGVSWLNFLTKTPAFVSHSLFLLFPSCPPCTAFTLVRSSGCEQPRLILLLLAEAEFLDEIQTKILRVLLYSQSPLKPCLGISVSSNSRNLLPEVTVHCKGKLEKGGKPDRKPYFLSYGLRNPYRNLKSKNSQDCAQKP